jgi:hypothetical protein
LRFIVSLFQLFMLWSVALLDKYFWGKVLFGTRRNQFAPCIVNNTMWVVRYLGSLGSCPIFFCLI